MRAATPHPASAEAPLYLGTYGWVRWLLALCLACALALATGPVGAQVSVSIIQTLAGGPGPSGVPATSVSLNQPSAVAIDSLGNLYITVQESHVVRKVDRATGLISIVAGNGTPGFSGDGGPATAAQLRSPTGVAVDSAGNVYIADLNNQRIRKVDAATGTITTFAGDGNAGFSGDGGPATAAQLNSPQGVAIDSAGNLYIANGYSQIPFFLGSRIRKVDATTGIIRTIAGNGGYGSSGDGGLATMAQLANASGVAVDSAGNVYIADEFNNRIRKVDAATGTITTIAGNGGWGSGGDGGPATAAQLAYPSGVAVDSAGHVYIANGYNRNIRKVDASTGLISTIVSNDGEGFSGDASPATTTRLVPPTGVAVDSAGNLYIADTYNHRIRKIDASTGLTSTIAGNGTTRFDGDGGPATAAQLNSPDGVAVDHAGNLYIADTNNHRIRKVNAATGTITTIAGNGSRGFSGDGGPATAAQLGALTDLVVDSAGNVYIANGYDLYDASRIRKVDSVTGIITTIGGGGSGGDGGQATSAQLANVSGIAVDSAGNVYIADTYNHRIRKVDTATGTITTIAGNGVPGFSGDGSPAIAAQLNYPMDVAVDDTGNVYITDASNRRIRKVNATMGTITTVAGDGNPGFGGDGGPATAGQLYFPEGLAVDSTGNLYIADRSNPYITDPGNHRIRKVDATTGIITTIAGDGIEGFGGDGGPATAAQLNSPSDVAVDSSGQVYIADRGNHRIRRTLSPGLSYPITTLANPAAGGTVGCSPNPVNHGGNASCTATPAAGYTLTGFSGACTGSTCTLTNVTSPKSVTANFSTAPSTRLVFVAKSGNGTGSVTSSPAGLSCDASCIGTFVGFPSTSAVTLTAQPSSGSTFAGWSGACTGTASCTIAAGTSTANVTANFTINGGGGGPLPDPVQFVTQQYMDFLGRSPESTSLSYWVSQLNAGSVTRAQLIESFMYSDEFQGRFGPLVRLYTAYFRRIPDYGGLMYWFNTMYPSSGGGAGLADVSQAFAQSAEFVGTYGALDNAGFVALVYQNVLGRDADPAGFAYWLDQLNRGMTRGQMMIGFSESIENQSVTATAQRITLAYAGMLRRTPSASEHAQWLAEIKAGRADVLSLINSLLQSAEYANRF